MFPHLTRNAFRIRRKVRKRVFYSDFPFTLLCAGYSVKLIYFLIEKKKHVIDNVSKIIIVGQQRDRGEPFI